MTPAFRDQVRAILDANKVHNRVREKRPGDKGYLISTQAELAVATDCDPNLLRRIIGPAREGTPVKYVDSSRWVARIRAALDMPPTTTVNVRATRAEVMRALDDLSDEDFKIFEPEILRRARRQPQNR